MNTYDIVNHLMYLEGQFFDAVMKKELPEKYYRWAHSKIPFALRKTAEYLEREKFMRRVHPDRIEMTRHGVVIAVWKLPRFISDPNLFRYPF